MISNYPLDSKYNIPILAYHQIVNNKSDIINDPWGMVRDYTLKEDFHQQMRYLSESGFSSISPADFLFYQNSPEKYSGKKIMITFDDGRLNVLTNALKIMSKYSFKGSVYVVTGLVSGRQKVSGHPLITKNMNWDHLNILLNEGWTIGSHTKNHKNLSLIPKDEIIIELSDSKSIIEDKLGYSCDHFAYPGGFYSYLSQSIVPKYYKTARQWQWQGIYNCQNIFTDPYQVTGMNISYHLSQKEFVRLVHSNNQKYYFQWNRLRVEILKARINKNTFFDFLRLVRNVFFRVGIELPHFSTIINKINNKNIYNG